MENMFMNTGFKMSTKHLLIKIQNWDLGNLDSISYQKSLCKLGQLTLAFLMLKTGGQ